MTTEVDRSSSQSGTLRLLVRILPILALLGLCAIAARWT